MSQAATQIGNEINIGRAQAALWTAFVFATGVTLTIVMLVAFNWTRGAATIPAAVRPAAPAPITRSDDYGLRQLDALGAAAQHDDFALRQSGIVPRAASSERDDFALRVSAPIPPSSAQRDDFALRVAPFAPQSVSASRDDYGLRRTAAGAPSSQLDDYANRHSAR